MSLADLDARMSAPPWKRTGTPLWVCVGQVARAPLTAAVQLTDSTASKNTRCLGQRSALSIQARQLILADAQLIAGLDGTHHVPFGAQRISRPLPDAHVTKCLRQNGRARQDIMVAKADETQAAGTNTCLTTQLQDRGLRQDMQAHHEYWTAKGAQFRTMPIDREAEIRVTSGLWI